MTRIWRSLCAPGDPIDLAVFRITVFAVLLGSRDVYLAPQYAGWSEGLGSPPWGLAWAAPYWPVSVGASRVALVLLVASASCALVGWQTRRMAATATLTGTFVLGVPQFSGSVVHYHHLVWFMALLSASPSGDALSIDSLIAARRGAPVREPSPEYGLPVRAAWVLIGLIYFFPGFWKLRASGIAWALSDNLAHQMQWKWVQFRGWIPLFRLDRYPALCRGAALSVVLFEVSFVALVFLRRLRPFVVAAAILLHLLIGALMRIQFSGLWLCYTVFFEWARWLSPLQRRLVAGVAPSAPASASGGAPRRSTAAAVVTALLLIVANSYYGFRGIMNGWPFACYPTFQSIVPAEMQALEIEAVDAAGRVLPVSAATPGDRVDPQRLWTISWSLLREEERDRRESGLRSYWTLIARSSPAAQDAAEVRFYRSWRSVDPDSPRVSRRELLHVHRP